MRYRTISTWPLYTALLFALASCGGATSGINPATALQGQGTHKGNRPACAPSGCTTDWASFGFDLQRTGYNPYESSVGVSNVGSLQKVWAFNVDSTMVHEPVYAYGVKVKRVPTNILYAGSAWGSIIYAINADTGAVVWQHTVPHALYTCGGTTPSQFSIGETPAIDRGKNLVYVADGHNQVHAYDLATGRQHAGWPLTVANYRNGDHNFMHGGLTYNPANGLLYAVTGSTCDISPWHGRIVAIDTTGPSIVGTFFTMSGGPSQGASGAGIWGPGGGSIDPSTNNVFVATGNADTKHGASQHASYAEQVIELSPTLSTILANNYPANIPSVPGDGDFDFGATPLLFQPSGCPPLLAAVNKSGMFELYDESTISNGPIQYISMSIPTDEASFIGVPAYDPETGYVYVGLPSTQGVYQAGMGAFSIASNCTLNTTPVWSAAFGPDGSKTGNQAPRSPISIANGVVYVSNYTDDTEFAFNAATGASLWTLSLPSWGNVGTVVANGMVYVGAGDGTITAFAPAPSASKKRKKAVRSAPIPIHGWTPFTPWGRPPTNVPAARELERLR
ncbi:MAG: PQQ-binding-like beta-propeller repeat protein [Candidatus Cybelea sp.]